MHAREIHTFVTIMSLIITQGLLQNIRNCSDYCKLLSNRSNNTRSSCDCSSHYQQKDRLTKQGLSNPAEIEDSKIYYEPVKNSAQQSSPQFERIKKDVTNSISTEIEQNYFKTKHRKMATQGKHSQNSVQHLHEIITKDEIPLYLDIDLHEPANNKTYREVLGDVFENLHYMEKNLSECINLHLFIFSKNIDKINKTSTNWGRNVKQYDKLSNSEVLTEIQNKCNQTGNHIEQNVYDIKRWSMTNRNIKLSKQADITTHDSLELSNETDAIIYQENEISMEKLYNNTSEDDIPWATASSLNNNYDTNNHSQDVTTFEPTIWINNYENDKPETQLNNITNTENNNMPLDEYFTVQLNNSSEKHKLLDKFAIQTEMKSSETDRTIQTSIDTNIQTTTEYTNNLNKYRRNDVMPTLPDALSNDNDSDNTMNDVTNRPEYHEGEYLIPKVITKELPNNTVQSAVDGYEVIPNLDYIDQSTISMASTDEVSQSVTEPYAQQNIDIGKFKNNTTSQASGFDIKGQLYFLYGKHQIPARFIQEQDGNLQLAIDGFLLCDKFLQQNEKKSVFMSLLCNCIVLQNCTQTERPLKL